jgi:hypothetical protein
VTTCKIVIKPINNLNGVFSGITRHSMYVCMYAVVLWNSTNASKQHVRVEEQAEQEIRGRAGGK